MVTLEGEDVLAPPAFLLPVDPSESQSTNSSQHIEQHAGEKGKKIVCSLVRKDMRYYQVLCYSHFDCEGELYH